jgi:hypothetical protein
MSEADGLDTKRIEVGSHHVVHIEKMYGPLVACDVRVWLESESGQWIVERECQRDGERSWEEMARFDCQESISFGYEEI